MLLLSKVVAMMKGQPGSNIPHRVLKNVRGKAYKFLQILPLSTIKKIVDVVDSERESTGDCNGPVTLVSLFIVIKSPDGMRLTTLTI